MVKRRADESQGTAFAFDDEEDIDDILALAAQQGDAATDDLGTFNFDSDEDASSKSSIEAELARANNASKTPEPVEEETPEPPIDLSEFDFLDSQEPTEESVEEPNAPAEEPVDELDALLNQIDSERGSVKHAAEPIKAPEPVTPEPIIAPEPAIEVQEPVVQTPILEPEPVAIKQEIIKEPAPVASTLKPQVRAQSMTIQEQVLFAQRIMKTVDVYRKLPANSKDIVAQLLTPSDENFSDNEATVAVRAIYAEPIQEETQKALIEAKNSAPVERVFYVLSLDSEVRQSLGDLVQAYAQSGFPENISDLDYAKLLVESIDSLDKEPVVYAEAMRSILEVARAELE